MAAKAKRDKDSLKNLAFSASDDEVFGRGATAADEDADDDSDGEEEATAEESARGPEDSATAGDEDEEDDDVDIPAQAAKGGADWRKEVERLFAQGKWQQVCERLGPPE